MKKLLYLLIFLPQIATSQEWKTNLSKADSFFYINSDSALVYYEKVLKYAVSHDTPQLAIRVYMDLGLLYNEEGNFIKAEKSMEKALEKTIELQDTNLLINVYGNLASIYNQTGNWDKAIEYMDKTIELLKKNDDYRRLALAYGTIGNIYFYGNNDSMALIFYKKAKKKFKEIGDSIHFALTCLNIGIIFSHDTRYDSAFYCLNTAYRIFKKNGNYLSMAKVSTAISDIYKQKKDYFTALKKLEESLQMYRLTGNDAGKVIAWQKMAKNLFELKQYKDAIDTLQKAFVLAKKLNNNYFIERITNMLMIINDSLKNYTEAFKWAKIYMDVHDSIYNKENSKKLQELQVRYEVEKKQHSIDLLKLQKKRAILFMQATIAVFILLAIIVLLFWNRMRIKNYIKNLETEQKMMKMQMNSHFIFNVLNAIQNYILKSETEKAATYLANFSSLIRKMLYFSREKYIYLNEEIETLKIYIEFQKIRFNNSFCFKIETKNIEPRKILIPPLLIQPFVENAIEHGLANLPYKGMVKIMFEKYKNFLKITVEDNGVGFLATQKKQKSKKSLAINITKQRILGFLPKKARKKAFEIKDLKNENRTGTRVTFLVPFVED